MSIIYIESAAITHVGLVRTKNEDNYYVNGKIKEDMKLPTEGYAETEDHDAYLYAVCDGMGGEGLGEVASMIAVKVLGDFQMTDIRQSAIDYMQRANKLICYASEKNNGVTIGTTLALLYIHGNKAISYNVGDSRVYLLRKKELYLLSEDHTEAARMVNMGVISEEDAKHHPAKHKLTQYLGVSSEEMIIEPYISQEIKVKKNDIFLVCSDGLTNMVTDDEIREILSLKKFDVVSLAKELSAAAEAHGGKDNTTVVVAKVF